MTITRVANNHNEIARDGPSLVRYRTALYSDNHRENVYSVTSQRRNAKFQRSYVHYAQINLGFATT